MEMRRSVILLHRFSAKCARSKLCGIDIVRENYNTMLSLSAVGGGPLRVHAQVLSLALTFSEDLS